MTPQDTAQVAVELERLRGAVDTGFATLNGRLDVALQRQSQTEADVAALERRHDQDISELRQQVDEGDRATRATVETVCAEMDGVRRQVWMAAGGLSVLLVLSGFAIDLITS